MFYRENNKFDDILTDIAIKKEIKTTLKLDKFLILGLTEENKESDKLMSYIILKYGDDVKPFSDVIPDRTPVVNVDYVPKKRNRRNLI